MLRWLLLCLAGLTLAGCGSPEPEMEPDHNATPALYEVRDDGGAPRAYLFGTMHSLPDGTGWRTPTLEAAIDQSDMLIVEIADLENSAAIGRTFTALGTSPGHPDLLERVPVSARPALASLIARSDFKEGDFARIETWAAALILARVGETGDSRNGADRALIDAFAGREVHELEGARKQLGIFDALAEQDQVDLLVAVIEEDQERNADPEKLRRAWLAGDVAAIEDASNEGILADFELRQALLVERNADWATEIRRLIDQGRLPMVAVGAAHIVGPEGLVARLQAQGFIVARIQ